MKNRTFTMQQVYSFYWLKCEVTIKYDRLIITRIKNNKKKLTVFY